MAEMTFDEAHEALAKQLIEIRELIGDDAVTSLREAHDGILGDCAAHSEGQWCCIDFLVGDADKL